MSERDNESARQQRAREAVAHRRGLGAGAVRTVEGGRAVHVNAPDPPPASTATRIQSHLDLLTARRAVPTREAPARLANMGGERAAGERPATLGDDGDETKEGKPGKLACRDLMKMATNAILTY